MRWVWSILRSMDWSYFFDHLEVSVEFNVIKCSVNYHDDQWVGRIIVSNGWVSFRVEFN